MKRKQNAQQSKVNNPQPIQLSKLDRVMGGSGSNHTHWGDKSGWVDNVVRRVDLELLIS